MKARNPEAFKEIGAWLGGFVPADDGKYQVIRDLNDDGQEAGGPEVAAGRWPRAPWRAARWMSVLALAEPAALEAAWTSASSRPPGYRLLRPPEMGLVDGAGRARDGTGAPFNLGEMTVTRCTVELDRRHGGSRVRGRPGPAACRAGRGARRAAPG